MGTRFVYRNYLMPQIKKMPIFTLNEFMRAMYNKQRIQAKIQIDRMDKVSFTKMKKKLKQYNDQRHKQIQHYKRLHVNMIRKAPFYYDDLYQQAKKHNGEQDINKIYQNIRKIPIERKKTLFNQYQQKIKIYQKTYSLPSYYQRIPILLFNQPSQLYQPHNNIEWNKLSQQDKKPYQQQYNQYYQKYKKLLNRAVINSQIPSNRLKSLAMHQFNFYKKYKKLLFT